MYIEEKIENILKQLDRISKTLIDLDKQVQDLRVDMDRKQNPSPYTPPPMNPWNPNPYSPWNLTPRCPVCNIDWSGPMGYVCGNSQCPMGKVTCNTQVTTTVPDAPSWTMGGVTSTQPWASNTECWTVYGPSSLANNTFFNK